MRCKHSHQSLSSIVFFYYLWSLEGSVGVVDVEPLECQQPHNCADTMQSVVIAPSQPIHVVYHTPPLDMLWDGMYRGVTLTKKNIHNTTSCCKKT